jgi:hypothetical protein
MIQLSLAEKKIIIQSDYPEIRAIRLKETKKFLGQKMVVLNKPRNTVCPAKLHLVVLLLVIPAVLFSPVAAHPPSAVNLTYNSSGSELAVTITHAVRDPTDHYIDLVEVRSGDAILISANYTSQPTTGTFTYLYTVPAKSGDLLEVNATCNKGGSLTETVLVPAGGSAAARSGIPLVLLLHMGLMTVGFICIATSAYIARFQRRWAPWFRMHKLFSHFGSAFIVAGLGVAVYMVGASGGPHFRNLHGVIGGAFALALVIVLTMGIGRAYVKHNKPLLRTIHILMGYLTLGLMVVNLILGFSMVFG